MQNKFLLPIILVAALGTNRAVAQQNNNLSLTVNRTMWEDSKTLGVGIEKKMSEKSPVTLGVGLEYATIDYGLTQRNPIKSVTTTETPCAGIFFCFLGALQGTSTLVDLEDRYTDFRAVQMPISTKLDLGKWIYLDLGIVPSYIIDGQHQIFATKQIVSYDDVQETKPPTPIATYNVDFGADQIKRFNMLGRANIGAKFTFKKATFRLGFGKERSLIDLSKNSASKLNLLNQNRLQLGLAFQL